MTEAKYALEVVEYLEAHFKHIDRLFDGVHRHLSSLGRTDMGALEDLQAGVTALVAEDGVVLSVVADLAARAGASADGTVSAADVQTASDAIKAEVAKLQAALVTADPTVAEPAPVEPAPVEPAPAPADTIPTDATVPVTDVPVNTPPVIDAPAPVVDTPAPEVAPVDPTAATVDGTISVADTPVTDGTTITDATVPSTPVDTAPVVDGSTPTA